MYHTNENLLSIVVRNKRLGMLLVNKIGYNRGHTENNSEYAYKITLLHLNRVSKA